MSRFIIAAAFALIGATTPTRAQSPAPIIVQAISPTQTAAPRTLAPAADADVQPSLKLLREMKAANDEILKKQTETLQQLDEIEKAAEQIRIYSKRG